MKKTLLTFIFINLFLAFSAQAQTQPEVQEPVKPLIHKANAGNLTLEGMYTIADLTEPRGYFRTRLFLSDGIALRTGLGYSYSSITPPNFEPIQFSRTATVRPGIEFHPGKSERFSPYIGFEYVYLRSKQGINHQLAMHGAVDTFTARTQHGANLVTGADYYFARNFYIGIEFSYGISGGTIETVNGSNRANTTDFFGVGQSLNGALRVGFAL